MAEGAVRYGPSETWNVKQFVYRYLRYWYLFAISLALAFGLATLYLRLAPREYLVSASLLIRDIDKGPDFQAGNPAFRELDIFNAATSIENEVEALRSVSLMQRVLAALSLETSYYAEGFPWKKELYGSTLPVRVRVLRLTEDAPRHEVTLRIRNNRQFDWESKGEITSTYAFGETVRTSYGTFQVLRSGTRPQVVHLRFHNLRDLAMDYNEELTVAQINKKANVLTVSLRHQVPDKARAILNKLIEVYNQDAREDRNLLASNTVRFIDDRLRDLSGELSAIERSVERFKRENQVTDVRSEAAAYLEESRNYDNQLSALNIQLDVVETLQRYLTRQKSQLELVPSNLRIDDPTLLDLIERYNELQLQRERILRTAEPTNPLVVNLEEQLANLRLNLQESLRTIRNGLQVTRNNLASRASSFQARIRRIPNIERELNAINRQEGVKRDLYVYLLQKREESALSLAATETNTRIIDPAMASKRPVSPKKPVVYGLALLLGLLAPLAFILSRELIGDQVRRKADVTRALPAPVLGEIGHFRGKGYLAIADQVRTPVLEHFRLLRANLDFAGRGQPSQVILVTSGHSGEGKTFVSLNLAVSLSLTGRSVVLVDFDLRRPRVLAALGLRDTAGVTDYLQAEGSGGEIDSLLESTAAAPDLLVMGVGALPANPTETLLTPRVGMLLRALRQRFDHVILDTTAVGEVADGYALMPLVDMTLLVVRYNDTPRVQLEALRELVTSDKLKRPYLVLNDGRKENSFALKRS